MRLRVHVSSNVRHRAGHIGISFHLRESDILQLLKIRRGVIGTDAAVGYGGDATGIDDGDGRRREGGTRHVGRVGIIGPRTRRALRDRAGGRRCGGGLWLR